MRTQPPRPGEVDLGEQILRVARRLRRASGQATQVLGVSPHQVRALHVAAQADGARVSALAERLRVAPRSATEVVDALQAKGLLVRSPDPADRRAVLVHVTDRGRAVLQEAQTLRRAAFAQALAGLSEQERTTLAAVLHKLDTEPGP